MIDNELQSVLKVSFTRTQTPYSAFGEDIYKTFEEKDANLLYFLVEDHPFIDGCKKIEATVFSQYLNKNNAFIKIINNFI